MCGDTNIKKSHSDICMHASGCMQIFQKKTIIYTYYCLFEIINAHNTEFTVFLNGSSRYVKFVDILLLFCLLFTIYGILTWMNIYIVH